MSGRGEMGSSGFGDQIKPAVWVGAIVGQEDSFYYVEAVREEIPFEMFPFVQFAIVEPECVTGPDWFAGFDEVGYFDVKCCVVTGWYVIEVVVNPDVLVDHGKDVGHGVGVWWCAV